MISRPTHPIQYIYGLTPDRQSPNKTPEPTAGSVTPRAVARDIDLKRSNGVHHAARGAPDPAVAHLMR